MLTSQAPVERLQLPHEPGEWIEVRRLSSAMLGRARQAAITNAARQGRETAEALGISLAELMASVGNRAESAGLTYDEDTLLADGVVAWSYPAEVSAETLGDLDEETRQYVLAALVPQPRSEADRKNGSASSTMPSKDEAPAPAPQNG